MDGNISVFLPSSGGKYQLCYSRGFSFFPSPAGSFPIAVSPGFLLEAHEADSKQSRTRITC